jgi:hypothetical protein
MFSKPEATACDGKAKYDKGWVAPTDLLRELAVHPCCDKGCATTLLGLPAAKEEVCGCCSRKATFTGFCAPTSSSTTLSVSEQQVRVLELINANRAPYDKFRVVAYDKADVVTEKNKYLRAELLRHFKTNGQVGAGNKWSWDNAYTVRTSEGVSMKVCKRLWCAVIGVTRGMVEHVQSQVRDE